MRAWMQVSRATHEQLRMATTISYKVHLVRHVLGSARLLDTGDRATHDARPGTSFEVNQRFINFFSDRFDKNIYCDINLSENFYLSEDHMTIQWYPGHMHKAQKEIRKVLPTIDVVIEVLDSRIPFSSENPLIAQLRKDKPCIKVLTKSDLADESVLASWQTYLEKEKLTKTLAVTNKVPKNCKVIFELCEKFYPERIVRNRKIKAMILGIPNVGKSTLINNLVGKTIAKTGNEPAVTKVQQPIHIDDNFMLLDTPGILWPKQEFEKSSYRLATTGAIKNTAMSYDDVAFFAAEFLLRFYPDRLLVRYELKTKPESELEFFEIIGSKRGCIVGGGRVDLNKISEIFLNEIRSGFLGGLCFETPEMIEEEISNLK